MTNTLNLLKHGINFEIRTPDPFLILSQTVRVDGIYENCAKNSLIPAELGLSIKITIMLLTGANTF